MIAVVFGAKNWPPVDRRSHLSTFMQLLRRLIRPKSKLFLTVVALATAVIVLVAAVLYQARQTAHVAAVHSADNIASALQRDIERNVDIVDLTLLNAQSLMSRLEGSNVGVDQQRSILFDGPKSSDHFGTMLVVDEHGRATLDSDAVLPRQHDYASRDWFTAHRDRTDVGLFMSLIPHSALTGNPVIVLSRRLNHIDGSFAGIVGASLEMSLFKDLFDSLKLMPGDDVVLATVDGRIIFRQSSGSRDFGLVVRNSAVSRAVLGRAASSFAATSLQGIDRLYAQHRLRNLPLNIFVGLSLRNVYRPWWIEAGTVGLAVAMLLLAAFTLMRLLQRELLRSAVAETDARQSEARYRFLADHATDVITCLDMNCRRTYVSPACRAVFGYEAVEMLGANMAAIIHPDDQEGARARFLRLASGETELECVTNRFQHKLGHYVWVEASLGLVRDCETGEPRSIMCCLRDISARKAQADQMLAAAEQLSRLTEHLNNARDAAERASRAKSRFLGSMSHELRTPLNGILGYAELLRIDGGLSPRQAPRVEAMMEAGKHLLEMINRVLDLTEIETGHTELRQAATDVRALASACLDVVRPVTALKALLLDVAVAPDVPQGILVDPTRLRQILLNLLGNAVKFTARGSVTLAIKTEGKQRLRFEVIDTGPGIAADQQGRLFHEFERLSTATATEIEGAGLGLALSARLAALMGGSLGYAGNQGGGSTFWLALPAADAELGMLQPLCVNDAGVSEFAAHILVVDDVAMNRDIAAAMLQAAGHHVVCAEGGVEAVAIASKTVFDVILMDVRMPGMDGLEASRRIRALDGVYADVPIVAMTAQAFTEQIEQCRSAGMDGHVSKPFDQAALLQRVAEARARFARPRRFEQGHEELAGDSGCQASLAMTERQ